MVLSATDANDNTTTFTYDTMNRLRVIIRPDNEQLITDYDDSSALPVVTSTMPVDSMNDVVTVTTTDGLGRPIKRETKDAAANLIS
ncbi:MAG: hypothetical protein ACE5HC_15885, partial [Candidatus Binatia bacterium]